MIFSSDSLFLDLIYVVGSVLLVVYALLSYLRNRWTRRGIPFADVHPLLGNMKSVVFGPKTITEAVRDFYLKHKNKPFIGFFTFTQPMIMINDLELVKTILIKDFSSFTDRNFSASASDPLQYHSMFTTKGQTWRNLRLKLTPTFTSGKMKKMFALIDACGQDLVKCLERELASNGEAEIKEMFARFTTDVIASTAFGIDGKSLENTESIFRHYMRKTVIMDLHQSLVVTLMFLFPSLVEKLGLKSTQPDVENYFRKTVWNTVEHREKTNESRNDFLDLMMQLRKTGRLKEEEPLDNGEAVEQSNVPFELDGDKFVAQCFLFLAAGFETSSSTMSYTLYELAQYPDIQKRLHEEITSTLANHGGKLTYDAVQEMQYLQMVVQETLRKYPVLSFLDRRVTRPYRVPGTGIELQPGDAVMIPVIGLHHDPELYPEPERFDPERFSEEQMRTRPPCTFLGFGDGPRICLGMRLGLLQAKIGLIYTLLNYEATPSTKTQVPLKFTKAAFPQAIGGIHLTLKKRTG
ncbi:hypothetical protein R5R35_012029 [Gryllus longicercus]|uniref:Cytochrome P450 n=1 Tax=Gryllus longicercus TaxID=2509291 RepID=A0AAN9V927_9ORTH